MATFLSVATRVTVELRRSNLLAEAKQAINDAIEEAARTRFYFNEMHGTTFNTVIGQEYYPDLGLVELDAVYFMQGSSRTSVAVENNLNTDDLVYGAVSGGQLESISRQGSSLRLYPIPSTIVTIYLDGYGKLSPSPLAADTDTNAWLADGEQYIRALAKRNVLRDTVRDYGEARALDAIAQDYKDDLVNITATRIGTGNIRATRW